MSAPQQFEYEVVVHHEDGSYWAEVAELPGCFASGDTLEELWDGLAEAIGIYLSSPEDSFSVSFGDREVIAESIAATVTVA